MCRPRDSPEHCAESLVIFRVIKKYLCEEAVNQIPVSDFLSHFVPRMGWWSTTMLTTHWTASATGSPPWEAEKAGTTTTPSSWPASTSARGKTNPVTLSVRLEHQEADSKTALCANTKHQRHEGEIRHRCNVQNNDKGALGLEKIDAICLTCVFIPCSKTKYVTHSPVSLSPCVYPPVLRHPLHVMQTRVTLGKPDGSYLSCSTGSSSLMFCRNQRVSDK